LPHFAFLKKQIYVSGFQKGLNPADQTHSWHYIMLFSLLHTSQRRALKKKIIRVPRLDVIEH
jgi:hypothetical protein